MSTDLMTMLLVEDNPADALLLRKMLSISRIASLDLIQVSSLAEARTALQEHKVDVVLLDLTLPDSDHLETLRAMRLAAPDEPIVVLTSVEDETLAMQAMREGAEDYLVKGQVDANLLVRAIRYAIERRYAREEMSKNASMLAEAQRIAHLGNWERNLLTGESYWSDELYCIFGFAPQTIPATYELFLSAIHPDDRASVNEAVYRASSSGTSYSIEFRILVADGSERLVYEQAEVTLDNKNCPVRIFGTLQDITARKRMEDAEREQRNLAEALRDTALALSTLDNLDELLDRILVQVARVVPYNTANVVLLEDGVAHLVRCRGYQDSALEAEMLKLRYTLEEVPLYRRMAESDVSLAIADTRLDPNWVPFPDSDLIRSYVSSPIRVAGEVVGFLNLNSATPGAFTDVQAERLQAFASQAAVAIQNVRLYESVRDYAVELEQRVMQRTAELEEANERLQELDELKTKFVADVSHELRTPLTVLNTQLYLLEHGSPQKQPHYIARIKDQVSRLSRLVENILDIAQLGIGQHRTTFSSVDLNSIVQQVVEALRPRADVAALRLLFEPDTELPTVWGEHNQLSRVATNLVANAINYTPVGYVRVRTYCNGVTRRVCLEVQDTGIGIEPEDMPHLFERFYRGKSVSQSNIPGTGLGLGIVKEIVDSHGGVIEVNSQPGEGSTFKVWLPTQAQL